MTSSALISAIVPARDEEAVIRACIESLALQAEISEIIAVNDQSSDRTLGILQDLARRIPRLRVVDGPPPVAGWVGKNHAVWVGAQQASGEWLLFTDADAVLEAGAAQKVLDLAGKHEAALVSFSPEQVLERWYEKALIPFVYVRLAQKFSFEQVNDPKSTAAKVALADLRRAAGNSEAALTLYREVLEADPKSNSARAGVVLSLLELGKKPEAEQEITAALQNPEKARNLPLLVGAGYWYLAHNDPVRGLELTQQAVSIEPRYSFMTFKPNFRNELVSKS